MGWVQPQSRVGWGLTVHIPEQEGKSQGSRHGIEDTYLFSLFFFLCGKEKLFQSPRLKGAELISTQWWYSRGHCHWCLLG